MDEKDQDHVLAFDTLFTTNRVQIIKCLLPYLDYELQRSLAIMIKYQELKYTISYFQNHPYQICSCSKADKPDIHKLLLTLLPYCSQSQKEMLKQVDQMFSAMEMYQEMSQMMELMKDVKGPENGDSSEDSQNTSSSPFSMDMLLNMLGPEQKEMIDMLKGVFPNE